MNILVLFEINTDLVVDVVNHIADSNEGSAISLASEYLYSDRGVAYGDSGDVVIYTENSLPEGASVEFVYVVGPYALPESEICSKYNAPCSRFKSHPLSSVTLAKKLSWYAKRKASFEKGFVWSGKSYQTAEVDRINIEGRAAKLTALLAIGDIALTDTAYTDSSGTTRTLMWRDLDNTESLFTVEQFLRFAIAVDEYIEDKYIESWT
jgi:hypothetical protein